MGRVAAVLATCGLLAVGTAVVEPAGATAEGTAAPALPPQGAIPNLEAAGWDLVFDDEFNQGSLDESVWWKYRGPGKSGPGMNTSDAVRVEPDTAQPGDGLMTITTYTENGKHYTGEVQTGESGQAAGFTGAYGYVEARVKLHTPPDSWDAFWLLPANSTHGAPIGDPAAAGPEIDIFETGAPGEGDGAEPPNGECDWQPLPFPCDQIAGGTLHWNGFDEHHETASQSIHWNGGDQDRFINYGLLWTPQGYRIYWDGILVFESAEGVSAKPEHLIFGQYNHEYRRPPGYDYGSLATSPYKMQVDYVKVWQRPVQELPNQTVPGNTSAAVPFSVTDHFSTSTSATVAAQPGTVQVTATSSDQNVVPNSNLVVLGNPAPGPTVTNTGFEGTLTGWTPSGTPAPTASGTKKHSGSTALKLADTGARVEQTVSGLQPNTTYALGGFYNLELEWNDANGNGRIDTGETVSDGGAMFNWGVQDVDTALPGEQSVLDTRERSEWRERGNYWAPHQNEWRERHLTFTTGPTTTSVKVFVDNLAYRNTPSDSNMYFDDLYVRPLTPPDRTVVARPKDATVGWTDVTLTARNAAGTQIGDAETFRLTFTRAGSFTNGDFESQPLGHGWELWDSLPGLGADVVVENPFTLNRALELAGPVMPAALDLPPSKYVNPQAAGTAFQTVNQLKQGQQYRLEVTGKGKFFFGVSGHGGADPCQPDPAVCTVDSASWSTKSFTFTMGATNTSARLTLLDWTLPDGASLVDNVKLTAVASAGNSYPTRVSPTFTSFGPQTVPSSAPVALPFDVPVTNPATTITGVHSSNQELVSDRDLRWAVNANNTMGVLGFSPQRERTGETTVTISYTGPGGAATKNVPITVTARQLDNPGFDNGVTNWSGAVIENGTLKLDGTQPVSQVVNGLPHGTDFLLGARTNGAVDVEVTPIADANMRGSDGVPFPSFVNPVLTASWTGSGWTDNSLRVATTQCPDCTGRGSRRHVAVKENGVNVDKLVRLLGGQFKITLTDAAPGDGQAVYVDGLTLVKAPTMDHIRDLSIYQTQTNYAWNTRTLVDVGNVPANGLWDSNIAAVTSSNTAALPTSNLQIIRPDQLREFEWVLQARAGAAQTTGRSQVTLELTDPATGNTSERPVTVNVNAGNNFNNGDFEDGTERWEHGWVNDGYEAVSKSTWRYLAPVDDDQVLRIGSGITGYKVSGLTAGQQYVVQANAVGSGSTVRVYANTVDRAGCYDGNPTTGCTTFAWGQQLGSSVTVNSPTWAPTPDLLFTPIADVASTFDNTTDPSRGNIRNETDVWIVVYDNDLGDYDPCTPDEDQQGPNCTNPDYDPWPASPRYCVQPGAGETCIDDIGVFKASDVGL